MKKKGYSIMLLLSAILTIAAIITLIPHKSAHNDNIMGYLSMCSFAPISSIILIALAGINCRLRKKLFVA